MLDERQINILESINVPNTYWNKKSQKYQYWFRSLLQKLDSALVFSGLPNDWTKYQDFFQLVLWARGYLAIFESERFGDKETKLAFQPCTLAGYDFYYQPTTALISNPKYQKELTIGKDCEILKLCPDFNGLLDIIDRTATQLAEIDKSIIVGLINARTSLVVTADSIAESEKIKKVYDKVQAGEPLIVWKDKADPFNSEIMPRKNPFDDAFLNDYTKTYIVTNLLSDAQTILDSFYMEIGLPVRTYDGKAHMLNAEAEMQDAQAQSRISCWVNTLSECFEVINEHYGTNMEVKAYERSIYSMDDGADVEGDGRQKPY